MKKILKATAILLILAAMTSCNKTPEHEHDLHTDVNEDNILYVACKSCDYKEAPMAVLDHEHEYGSEYGYNQLRHWKKCSDEGCNKVSECENHKYYATIITPKSTDGEKDESSDKGEYKPSGENGTTGDYSGDQYVTMGDMKCTVCGYKFEGTIVAKPQQ